MSSFKKVNFNLVFRMVVPSKALNHNRFNGNVGISHARHFGTNIVSRASKQGEIANNTSKPIRITPKVYFQPARSLKLHQQQDENSKQSKKLVVLMTWLGAQEKHINRYRNFYLERGFDVVNVRTTPIDILLPKIYAKRNAADCIKFLLDKEYEKVFYHGFSVGAAMYAQVVSEMFRLQPDLRDKLSESIRGIVIDSGVAWEDFQTGVARSLTKNKALAKVIENIIILYKLAATNIASKYYQDLQVFFMSGPLNRPSMHVYSKSDRMISLENVEKLADSWMKAGIELDRFVVDDAGHVQVFHKYNDEYVRRLEGLLKRVDML